jgi:hypothetical protein
VSALSTCREPGFPLLRDEIASCRRKVREYFGPRVCRPTPRTRACPWVRVECVSLPASSERHRYTPTTNNPWLPSRAPSLPRQSRRPRAHECDWGCPTHHGSDSSTHASVRTPRLTCTHPCAHVYTCNHCTRGGGRTVSICPLFVLYSSSIHPLCMLYSPFTL